MGVQIAFVSEIVGSYLMKDKLQNQALAQQQAAQQLALQQKTLEQQAEQSGQDQAAAENKLSEQTINATWNAIDQETRSQILDVQRAWIKAKAANCNIQAASASTDPILKETARLACDTSANQARIVWLKQYLPQPTGD
jgi:uncharacterized protein YecT (DUF1311 family)